ncbi:MAG TPA: sugar ABC transporter permease [Gallicola sp.]|nr:sugar ABC transporter permease [Gallicola sp.]
MKFLYLPTLVGTFAFAIIYRYLFTYDGIINSMLFSLLKIKINWLDNGFNAKNVFVIAMIWSSLGINTLLIVNALNNIPKDVLESAEVDGSNNFQSLIYIMIPYIKKLILFVVLTTFVATVNLLDLPYNLTQGAPNFETMTLGFYIYKVAFGYRDFSYAATIGITIFVLFIFIYISFKKVVSVYEKNI